MTNRHLTALVLALAMLCSLFIRAPYDTLLAAEDPPSTVESLPPTSLAVLHFPTYSIEELVVFAQTYLEEKLPEALDLIGPGEAYYLPHSSSPLALIGFPHIVHGIPVADEILAVVLNRHTGAVDSVVPLNRIPFGPQRDLKAWREDLAIPAADAVPQLTQEQAKQAIIKEIGMRLHYKTTTHGRMTSTGLFETEILTSLDYSWNSTSWLSIDAKTGNQVLPEVGAQLPLAPDPSLFPPLSLPVDMDDNAHKNAVGNEALLDASTAEALVRSLPGTSLQGLKLTAQSYSLNYDDMVHLNLGFSTPGDQETLLAIASFDVKTGYLMSYTSRTPLKAPTNTTPKSREELTKSAEALLKLACPGRVTELQSAPWGLNSYYASTYDNNQTKVTFFRQVNGLPVHDDHTFVFLDTLSGALLGYNQVWTTGQDYPEADAITIDVDEAAAVFLEQHPPKLVFLPVPTLDPETGERGIDLRLAYAPDHRTVRFTPDPFTGKITLSVAFSPSNYTDLAGHVLQEKVQKTADFLLFPVKGEFEPEAVLTQAELLTLAGRLKSTWLPYIHDDDPYPHWQEYGLIHEEEIDPEKKMTCSDGLVFLTRITEYREFIEICDALQLGETSEVITHVAKYLNMIDDDYEAEAPLTRLDLTLMIYNYLSR